MEIRVLKYFLTVAREGSITRAAEILHVTQPTLSRQILELERETGVKLLDRGSRHVSLTSDGLLLKRRAEEIVDLVDKTEKELSGNKTVEGTVNCAGGELLVMDHFSDLIMRFQEKHPLVRFDINTDITGRVNEKMDSGLIDTAIFVRPFDAEKYDYVPIGPEARFWRRHEDRRPSGTEGTCHKRRSCRKETRPHEPRRTQCGYPELAGRRL